MATIEAGAVLSLITEIELGTHRGDGAHRLGADRAASRERRRGAGRRGRRATDHV